MPFLNSKSDIILPDLIIFEKDGNLFVEVKHKSAFTQYRSINIHGQTNAWQTGIDLKPYVHYCAIADNTSSPLWLYFLHDGKQAKDSPVSPSGLYGAPIDELRCCEDHRSDRWGYTGMVYWNIDDLYPISEIETLFQNLVIFAFLD